LWTTTRYRLVLLPTTLSLLSVIKMMYTNSSLSASSDVVFDLCADDRGHWSLGLPKSDAVSVAGEFDLSLWTKELSG